MDETTHKRVCDGTPPSHPVWWDITPRKGPATRGFGQTAFVAAANVRLQLTEVAEMHVSDDQGAPPELGTSTARLT